MNRNIKLAILLIIVLLNGCFILNHKKEGVVNKRIAVKYAKKALKNEFGYNVFNFRGYSAFLINDSTWLVTKGTSSRKMGGGFEVLIHKKNGVALKVTLLK